VSSRRQFLKGAGVAVAGVAAGAAVGPWTLPAAAGGVPVTPAARDFAEAVGMTGDFGAPLRLGVHRVLWSVPTAPGTVALTFDDGPSPQFTPRVLDALAAAGATATFYVMGASLTAHPELVREAVAAGHEIGNHTWSHLDLSRLAPEQVRDEVTRCAHAVEDLTGRPAVGFRPPRGELTGYALRVCAELGSDVHVWSCTRGPGDDPDPSAVAAYVGTTAVPGDVVGLHDGIGRHTFDPGSSLARQLTARREVEVRALPAALARLRDRGLAMVGVGRLQALATAAPAAT
jgi:peptidoglycan/xylan/chitin deacetylase (PgdA/CDA1 family)